MEPPTSPGFFGRDIPAIFLADHLVTPFQFQSKCRILMDGRTRHERTVVTKTGLRFPPLSKIGLLVQIFFCEHTTEGVKKDTETMKDNIHSTKRLL